MVDKIKQLKDVAGADGAAFENVDLDSEWDPDVSPQPSQLSKSLSH